MASSASSKSKYTGPGIRWGLFVLIIISILLAPGNKQLVKADGDNEDTVIRSMNLAGEKNPLGIRVTRWPEAAGGEPITYEEWKAKVGQPGPFTIELVKRQEPQASAKDIKPFYIIVNDALQGGIQASLDQYMLDLAYDNYLVELYATSGGTCEDLRQFFQNKYNNEGLVGAILIGNLPIAWYETFDCWEDTPHEYFPCDLYYMDMDGTWIDNNTNDMFDEHTGDVTPEIYIGRLWASTLTYMGATEPDLLQNYFNKNHLYRTGQMTLSDRALLYIDDDWETSGEWWSENVGLAYDDRTLVNDPNTTIASDYKDRLPQNYELIQLAAHSSPTVHWFKIPPDVWHSTVDYEEMVQADPVALFYNLFACSNAHFAQPNYMAGWYIFCQTYGLIAIGSTKTGSMLNFEYFYQPLGENKTFGQSFADWFAAIGADGFQDWEICWFYGMTLCGDPTLSLDMSHAPYEITISVPDLPDGVYYEEYNAALSAAGGTPPYSWQIATGSLPDGLELDAETGIISGIPLAKGIFDAEVCVCDTAASPRADTAAIQISITCVCGDPNGDKSINLADTVYLINFIFHNGSAPDPMKAGDANCDISVNIADAVFLLNFIFHQGPEPLCP